MSQPVPRSRVAPGCCTCACRTVAAEAKATERGRVAHGPRGAPASVRSPGGGSSGCSQPLRARRPPRSGGLRGLGRVRQSAGQPGAMAVAVRALGALRGLAALGGRGASRAAMVSAAGAGERACGGKGAAARAPPRLPRVTSTERRAHARPRPGPWAGRGWRTRVSSRPATAAGWHLPQNKTSRATSVVVYELAHQKQSRVEKKKKNILNVKVSGEADGPWPFRALWAVPGGRLP